MHEKGLSSGIAHFTLTSDRYGGNERRENAIDLYDEMTDESTIALRTKAKDSKHRRGMWAYAVCTSLLNLGGAA